MQPSFIHLKVHTEFSLVDGLVKIKPLVKRLTELNMPALAITEHANLFSLVKFYKTASSSGIKPIAGADVLLFNPDDAANPWRLTFLAANHQGYVNLTELISKGYQKGQRLGVPMVKLAWIEQHRAGLIMLSGAMAGDVGKALLSDNIELARKQAMFWAELFPDSFYLELHRVGKAREEDYIAAALELAAELDLPVVATNDVRFLYAKDFQAHEVRVCINQGRVLDDDRRPKDYTDQQYLRSAEEMAELFADIPEALANSVEIAKRCNVTLTLGKYFLPDYPVPKGMTIADVMSRDSWLGLEERLTHRPPVGHGTPEENRRVYEERLDFELKMISQMGFPGYFMIVADFIQWAKNHGIPVGPGRGSGAGSLVAYCLKITDLDPIEFDLLFERFLNPERVSMPDFDIDFCMDRRDEVIDYVAQHYGRDHVAQIITYGSMAAKAVIRDVGRVLGHGYGFVDRLAKLIPFEVGMTLTKALQDSPELKQLYDTEEEVKNLVDMALSLEGTARNTGKHAGGVVIAPTPLTNFAALSCEEDGSNLVTQFDKDDVEAVGLVKFDFLGLRTLTIIDWALQDINARLQREGKEPVDISLIPRDDPASYELLKNGDTTAVFQLESRGMKELIKKLRPDCFDDIIALVALFRPGPLESGMVDDYVNVKHKRQEAEYAHPLLEPILKPTNGVILYQEQVMQIAREMALYTLGGADMLRRAMGKKKFDEMAKEREKFTKGAAENNVDESISTYVFDLMEKFAGYGFNKTVHKYTKICTITGTKNIKDCHAGDIVFSMNADGSIEQSEVVALHDHGQVPLWLVEFDDGTQEQCTLDHKWLTAQGQVPLWQILHLGLKVWGTSTTQTRHFHTSEKLSNLHESNSFRTECRQRNRDVLWRNSQNAQESNCTFSNLCNLPRKAARNSGTNLQRLSAYRRNAPSLFTNCQENRRSFQYAATTRRTLEKLARCQSRKTRCHSCQSARFTQTLKNGNVVRTTLEHTRLYTQYPFTLRYRADVQTSGFYLQRTEHHYRSGWTLAFSTNTFQRITTNHTATRPLTGTRDYDTRLAAYPPINGMLSEREWRISQTQLERITQHHSRQNLAGHLVLRQPVRASFVGWQHGYDLEVNHSEHNFLLASGLCCSNSHSAAYALVAYQTAWLKAHFPAEFMAAVLSSDMDNTDKVVILIEECKTMRLSILPPSINYSQYKFTVKDGQIVYGLGALKGVGEAAIEDIIAERKHGAFKGLYDFCKRVDLRKCNKRVLEALIRGGALDEFGDNRAAHFEEIATAMKIAEQHGKMAETGQNDLFGLASSEQTTADNNESYGMDVKPWRLKDRADAEKAVLGFYLTVHPMQEYETELKKFIPKTIAALLADMRGNNKVRIAGLAKDIGIKQNKQGKSRGFAVLDDNTAQLELSAYREAFDNYQALFNKDYKDTLLIAEGSLAMDEYLNIPRLTVDRIYSYNQAREIYAKCLNLIWKPTITIGEIKTVLTPFRGGLCSIQILYTSKTARAKIQLGEAWRVKLTDDLLIQLDALFEAVELEYK